MSTEITPPCPENGQERQITALEQLERDLTPTEPPPCPDWCEKDAGHPYDSTEYDFVEHPDFSDAIAAREISVCRYHRAVLRWVERENVEVTQLEDARVRDGVAPVVTFDSAVVYASISFEDEMSASAARELGDALLMAAVLVDQINRGD